jgi:hypothetical protein
MQLLNDTVSATEIVLYGIEWEDGCEQWVDKDMGDVAMSSS